MLAVGKSGLEFRSKAKQLTVPYSSVLNVRRATIGADVLGEKWAIMKFRVGDSEKAATFMRPILARQPGDLQDIDKGLCWLFGV